MVNYNSGDFLKDCVQCALSQADEVLVVDNASADDSVEQATACFVNERRLKIIRSAQNKGFATGCNIGIKQSQGNRILFLNPDCRLEQGAVAEMLKALEASNTVGMVGGLLINSDGSEQAGGRRAVPTPWRSFVRAFGLNRFSSRWPKLFSDYLLHNNPLPSTPEEVDAISGACMLVKREAIDDIGLWDEAYFLHCEDLDWCMRFRQKRWKIMFVPTARIFHALGVCSRSKPIFVEWHKHKGMMRFYGKFFRHQYPAILFWFVGAGVWIRFNAVMISHGVRHFKQWLRHRRA